MGGDHPNLADLVTIAQSFEVCDSSFSAYGLETCLEIFLQYFRGKP